jgi:hypothetical protein
LHACSNACEVAPSATNVQRKVDEDGCPYWDTGPLSCLTTQATSPPIMACVATDSSSSR